MKRSFGVNDLLYCKTGAFTILLIWIIGITLISKEDDAGFRMQWQGVVMTLESVGAWIGRSRRLTRNFAPIIFSRFFYGTEIVALIRFRQFLEVQVNVKRCIKLSWRVNQTKSYREIMQISCRPQCMHYRHTRFRPRMYFKRRNPSIFFQTAALSEHIWTP